MSWMAEAVVMDCPVRKGSFDFFLLKLILDFSLYFYLFSMILAHSEVFKPSLSSGSSLSAFKYCEVRYLLILK